jgi:CRP-like cAMP-binding protein
VPELDPATLAERVLRLSRTPPFDEMPVEDVTLLAAVGREQLFPTRTVLAHAGERTMAHYVQLAGRLRLLSDVPELAMAGSHTGVGALSVFGGVTLPVDLIAEAGTVLLVLDRDALMGVLEEHGHVARSTLRLLARKLLEVRRARGIESRLSRPPPTLRLDLVSRMLTLRESLGLGSDGMATIARLARVVRARQFTPGSVVCEGDQPADVIIPVDGELVLHLSGGRQRIARPGEVLGLVEAVAGVPVAERATAGTEVTALVLSHHELAEDIEDEDALCFELIRNFSAQLWTALTGSGPMPDVARPHVDGGN